MRSGSSDGRSRSILPCAAVGVEAAAPSAALDAVGVRAHARTRQAG